MVYNDPNKIRVSTQEYIGGGSLGGMATLLAGKVFTVITIQLTEKPYASV